MANRALVRIEQLRLQEAEGDLTRAISSGRRESLMFLLRARVWLALGKSEEAERDLAVGKSLTPVSVEGRIHRALAFRHADPMAAIRELDVALAMNPSSRKALHNKAAILSQLDRSEEAIQTLTALIDAHPNDAAALLGRGLLRARRAEREAALADGTRGVELDDSPQQRYQLARILAQTSKLEREDADLATDELRKALQVNPRLVRLVQRDLDLQPILHLSNVKLLLSAAATLHAVESTNEERIARGWTAISAYRGMPTAMAMSTFWTS